MPNPPTSTAEHEITPPQISRELVDYLLKVFPDRLPKIDTSDRELGALIGQQRVIQLLKNVLAEQEHDTLTNVLQKA